MKTSPYKFLDSYTKADADIFFGRETEIEELYSRVFHSNLILIYGASGTGKTSIIQCGLSNKFEENDWKPFFIRRNENIIHSIHQELDKQSISSLKKISEIPGKLYSIYLDYLTPIYLIFDQFEELFIFGNENEKREFVELLKTVTSNKDLNTHILISIREEYLANLSEFENEIPTLFQNRIRIEKMKMGQAIRAIEGPCEVCNIHLDDKIADSILELISDTSGSVELTWLQVLMDRIHRNSLARGDEIRITMQDVEGLGKIGDILGSFLEEQLKLMKDGEQGEAVLKTLISPEGTKRQLSIDEIKLVLETYGFKIGASQINEILQYFINVRILCEKDENQRYELKHDSLAQKIFERLTLFEKELLEVRNFIEYAFKNFQSRRKFLSVDDLTYIQPYEEKLILNKDLLDFIKDSKRALNKKRIRIRILWIIGIGLLLMIMAGFSTWALFERRKAVGQKNIAENQKKITEQQSDTIRETNYRLEKVNDSLEIAKSDALNAKDTAVAQLYRNIQNSLSISPLKMNVLYWEVSNPVSITSSGISNDSIFPYIDGYIITNDSDTTFMNKGIAKIARSGETFLVYDIHPNAIQLNIGATGITNYGDSIDLGYKNFRVQSFPGPFATLGGHNGGNIAKETVLAINKPEIHYFTVFDILFKIKRFSLSIHKKSGEDFHEISMNEYLSDTQKEAIRKCEVGDVLVIDDIIIDGPSNFDSLLSTNLTFILDGDKYDIEIEKERKVNKILALAQQENSPKICYRLLKEAYAIDSMHKAVNDKMASTFIKIQFDYYDSIVSEMPYIKYINKIGTFVVNSPMLMYGNRNNEAPLKNGIFYTNKENVIPIYTTDDQINDAVYLDSSEKFLILTHDPCKLLFIDLNGRIIDSVIPMNPFINRLFDSNDEKVFVMTAASSRIIDGKHDNRAIFFNSVTYEQKYIWGKYHAKANIAESQYDVTSDVCISNNNTSIYASFPILNKLEKWSSGGLRIDSIALTGSPEHMTMYPDNRLLLKIKGTNNTNKLFFYDIGSDSLARISLPDGYLDFYFSGDGRYIIYLFSSSTSVYDQLTEEYYTINYRLPAWENTIILQDSLMMIVAKSFQIIFPLKNSTVNIIKILEQEKLFGDIPKLPQALLSQIE